MAIAPGSGLHLNGAVTRANLVEILETRGDQFALLWASEAGDHATRWPEFERYLRRLIAGLVDVFRGRGWSSTQNVIDELAEMRVSSGLGVFRFSESYQGLKLASENERMHTRIIKSLIMSLEARDPFTKGHSLSVAILSQRIADALGPQIDPARVYLAGLLHDVGKIGIPDKILLKAGPLARDEWAVMKNHPVLGATILKPIKLYADVVSAVLTHHENFDGTGYPYGVVGDDIPQISRILRVADSFDAMTTTRAYRPGRSAGEAIAEISVGSGTNYDPATVEAFTHVIGQSGVMSELGLATLQIDLGEFVI